MNITRDGEKATRSIVSNRLHTPLSVKDADVYFIKNVGDFAKFQLNKSIFL